MTIYRLHFLALGFASAVQCLRRGAQLLIRPTFFHLITQFGTLGGRFPNERRAISSSSRAPANSVLFPSANLGITFLFRQHGLKARGMDVANGHSYGVGGIIGLGDEVEAQ